MDQIVQLVGAIFILTGFAGVQFQRINPHSWTYLILNAVGSAILAVLGYHERQWGFFLLEGVWALVSVWAIYSKATGRNMPGGAKSH
jgi:membrane-bound ClpP family serine protease